MPQLAILRKVSAMPHCLLSELPYAFKVPASVKEVPLARRRVVARARRIGLVMDEEVAGEVELMACEVITNAIVHTGAPCVVCVRRVGARLRVEVTDVESTSPAPAGAGADDETGRGLLLVRALADAWGTIPDRAGKRVWFERKLGLTPCPSIADTPCSSASPTPVACRAGCHVARGRLPFDRARLAERASSFSQQPEVPRSRLPQSTRSDATGSASLAVHSPF